MSRKRKQILNSSTALAYQILLMIYSFLIPRLYLKFYGSQVNGLVASINSFLGVISFMDLGIGAVIQSNMYKPLAEHDSATLSKIYKSARNFFWRIVAIYLVYLCVYLVVYTNKIKEFDSFFTASLILILAINLIAEYLFGIVNQCVLIADQKGYVVQSISCVLLFTLIIVNSAMIQNGCSIQVVRLVYSIVISIKPVLLALYVKRNYNIDYSIKYSDEPIKQKWNGVAQHVASYVTTSTDTLILTIFSTLSNVSVYYVYNLVVNGIKQVVSSLMNGLEALFGNMLAKGEEEYLSKRFYELEWISHTVITILFSCCAALIRDFVLIYTSVIKDADYNQGTFGVVISLAIAMWCIRTTYYAVVKAAGHYKETQTSSIIEMTINILVSIIAVFKFGLIGVAVGTLLAMAYRTTFLAFYIERIINYSGRSYIKHIVLDIFVFCATITISTIIGSRLTLGGWLIKAFIIAFLCVIVELVVNCIIYPQYFKAFVKMVKRGNR